VESSQAPTSAPGAAGERALGVQPVFWAWLVAVGVDLFYNAGVFSPLFDQGREPGLLADPELFARIPVAYLVVALEVTAVAWAIDRSQVAGALPGAALGAGVGMLLGVAGVVWLWTAIEMTASFVVAGVVVQLSMMAAAGIVLGAVRSGIGRLRLRLRCLAAVMVAAILAVVAQNLLG